MNNKSQLESVIGELRGQNSKDLEAQRAAIDKQIVDMIAKQTALSVEEIVKGLSKRKKTVKEIPNNTANRIGNVNAGFYADAVSASAPKLRTGDSAANIGAKIYAVMRNDIEERKLRSELVKNREEELFGEEKRRQEELIAAINKSKSGMKAQKAKKELPLRDEKGRFIKKEPTPQKAEAPAPKAAETKTPAPKPAETPAPAPAPKPTTATKPPPEAPAAPSAAKPITSAKPSVSSTAVGTATKVGVGTIVAGLTAVGITNEYTQAAVLSNIKKESNFKLTDENLNYTSVDRLREVFKSATKGKTDEELSKYLRNPEALAEFVYGKRMGNNQPGDGFKYRGRGSIQLTGKNNYAYYGKLLNVDLVKNPDLVLDPTINTQIVGLFVKTGLGNNVNSFKNQQDANRAVTQTIGGAALNLNTGYGAKLLSKVEENSKEFSGAGLAAASIENKELKATSKETKIAIDNTKTNIIASGGSTPQTIRTPTPSERPAIIGG